MAQGKGFVNPYLEVDDDGCDGRQLRQIKSRITSYSSFDDEDWFFFNLVGSKHSTIKDLRVLKYDYTLPEVMKLKEWVDMMSAIETAHHKDQESKHKNK